jgi:hypothetical protein
LRRILHSIPVSVQRLGFNTLTSLLWTVIFLGPVYVYCRHHVPPKALYLFAAVGMLPYLLPRSSLRRVQLTSDPKVYRRLKVTFLIAFTQDAPWFRLLAGKTEKRISRGRDSLARVVRDTWTRERLHTGLLLFCALCSAVALSRFEIRWFVALTAINILYNLYPVWLQQYIRMRVKLLARGTVGSFAKTP